MTPDTVVFLGSSLPRTQATAILDAVYLRPARAGDVLRAVDRYCPRFLGLIDGLFEQVASVRHKELLYAMKQGVRVYGAASMGALRAAELASFGMVGIGRVYDMYALGDIDGDDEVAISHGPETEAWRPLSEALVNIRWTTWRALVRGIISAQTHDAVVSAAVSTFYPLRHWRASCDVAHATGAPVSELTDLLAFVEAEKSDVKAADTRDLLLRIRTDADSETGRSQTEFQLAETAELCQWIDEAESGSSPDTP